MWNLKYNTSVFSNCFWVFFQLEWGKMGLGLLSSVCLFNFLLGSIILEIEKRFGLII